MSDGRVYAALADSSGPASIAELAERSGLHPNTVRLHLRRMEAAGVTAVSNENTPGRGRPRQLWRLLPGAEPGGSPPVAYSDLARWLSRALSHHEAVNHGRRIGAERAAEREAERIASGAGPEDVADALEGSLRSMGFRPVRRDSISEGRAQARFRLCNCPYRDVAAANPGVVCALHRGIAEGELTTAGEEWRLSAFEARDPEEAGCVIEIERSHAEKAGNQG